MVDWIEGPHGRLAVSASGSGAAVPLLFLHSDGGRRDHWEALRARYDGQRRSAAFDRRGHGDSAPPRNGRYGYAEEVADVVAVADALDFNRFVLIGHSGGGAVAFLAANSVPDRVHGLVLVDPAPDPAVLPAGMIDQTVKAMRDDFKTAVSDYYASIAGPDEALKKRIVYDAVTTAPATLVGLTGASMKFDPRAVAGRYCGEGVAIIQSEFDVDGALHRIARFPHRAIDGVGHWLHLGAPDELAEMLDAFLVKVDQPVTAG